MATTYGYARCSTDESKQDIKRQKRDLLALGVEDDSKIYWEYESGTKTSRPELTKLLSIVEPGDTIAATEVSRLTRSTKQLCELMDEAKEKHLRLLLGSLSIDCRDAEPDPLTMAMLQIGGVFAELEQKMISQRVKSGIQNAKAKGKVLGRPRHTLADIPKDFWELYKTYKTGNLNKKQFAGALGVSRPTLYKYLEMVEANEAVNETANA